MTEKKKILLNVPAKDAEFFKKLLTKTDVETIYTSDVSSREADYVLLPQKDVIALRESWNFIQTIMGFSDVLLNELDGELNDLQHEDVQSIFEYAKKTRIILDDFFSFVPIYSKPFFSLKPVHITHKLMMLVASLCAIMNETSFYQLIFLTGYRLYQLRNIVLEASYCCLFLS